MTTKKREGRTKPYPIAGQALVNILVFMIISSQGEFRKLLVSNSMTEKLYAPLNTNLNAQNFLKRGL